MTLLALILALVIDQARPLSSQRVDLWIVRYGRFIEARFNAGERRHGQIAWSIAVALPAVLLFLLQLLLSEVTHLNWLVHVLGVALLWLVMGFRKFSHYFTDIQLALRMGELPRARALLADWRARSDEPSDQLAAHEVARLAIEEGLLCAHRHVFALFFWYVALGPAGALLYRLSATLGQQWGNEGGREFGGFAALAFGWLDWLPVRLSALSFAIVGNFEDAVNCWRNQAAAWSDKNAGILLATGAGALGVRLGLPLTGWPAAFARPELGLGLDADVDCLQSAIGLIWRSLLLALLLLALLWLANRI